MNLRKEQIETLVHYFNEEKSLGSTRAELAIDTIVALCDLALRAVEPEPVATVTVKGLSYIFESKGLRDGVHKLYAAAPRGEATVIAHSKSQYKRLSAQGANPIMREATESAAGEVAIGTKTDPSASTSQSADPVAWIVGVNNDELSFEQCNKDDIPLYKAALSRPEWVMVPLKDCIEVDSNHGGYLGGHCILCKAAGWMGEIKHKKDCPVPKAMLKAAPSQGEE